MMYLRQRPSERRLEGFPLRDKVFSGLNTDKPVVRSITPQQRGLPEDAVDLTVESFYKPPARC